MFASPIETERLLLRQPGPADAAAIYANYASDPRVTRYLSWPAHRSLADAEKFLQEQAARIEAERELAWAIIERATCELQGMIGVSLDPPNAALGYCLAHEVWGWGFATEAAQVVVPLVWSRREIARLEAFCHTVHVRSARVLEKAGLCYAGVAKAHSVLPALGEVAQDMSRYVVERPTEC